MNSINNKTNLQFHEDFFKEEVRCDYLVTEKLKKIWAIEIDLLNELLRVCKKYDIKVTLFAGSLLGAVRHKGFIPWDDDLDVCLTRPEYEKLLKVADKEFKYPYFFQTALSDREFFIRHARLRNSLTTGLITGNESVNYNNGIYMDVYVLDGYIEDEKKLNEQYLRLRFWGKVLESYNMHFYNDKFIKKAKRGLAITLLHYTVCKLISFEKAIKLFNGVLQKYNNKTERIAIMTSNMCFIQKYWCNLNELKDISWVPYENILAPIPSAYNDMLTHMYGNYMEFPPAEQRGEWHENMIKFNPDIPYKEYIDNIKK